MFAASPPVPPGQPGILQWSGYTWQVRPSQINAAPGPNAWSDSLANARVEAGDVLRLAITPDSPQWRCVEVEGPSLGYGRYSFEVATNPNTFDHKPVLGLFTYDDGDDGSHEYREIDIEYSAWGDSSAPRNSWFTVWHGGTGYQSDHGFSATGPYTSQFTWQPGQIYFSTHDATGELLGEHIVNGTVYSPATETIRLNLWLYDGTPPVDGQPVVVYINKFTFTPNATYTLPPASSKVMTFAGGVDGFTLKRGASVMGGNLLLECNASSYSYAYTGPVFNLENSSVDTKIVATQPTSAESWWFMRYNNDNYIAMYVGDGTLYTRICRAGVVEQHTTSYNSGSQLYWRIRESAGVLYCETSPDRSSWTLVRQYAHSFGVMLNTMMIRYECSYWGVSQSPTPFTIAAVNAA